MLSGVIVATIVVPLLSLLLLLLSLLGCISGSQYGRFVTSRWGHNRNWPTVAEEWVASGDIPLEQISVAALPRNHPLQQQYKLRFQPHTAMPRIFWHKFPQKQQEQPAPTTTVLPMTTEPPTEPDLSMTTDLVTVTPTEATVITTTASVIVPTEIVTTTSRPKFSVKPTASTTVSTIMKPPIGYKPPLGQALKNFLLFGAPSQLNLIQKQSGGAKTHGKSFLSLFEVIKFENNKCAVAMGDIRSMEGICYHEFECKSLGGIPTERCAEGVGVCCIFLTGCGDTTNQPVVYFESPNYPHAVRETIICVLVVNLRERVQQLRLDFLMFELNRPTDGDCVDDQFLISGQNMNFEVPVLCGINTGQHMYIHVAHSYERKIYLSFFAKVPTGGRSYNIKITQLETDLAPDGCLQYFSEKEGVVKSFNYDIVGTIVDNPAATYFNNLNYVICLERGKEICTITYATDQTGGDQPDFQIVNKSEDENDLVPVGQAGAGIFNCPDDFIGINQVRLCGERFNDGTNIEDYTQHATVKDLSAGPFVLPFRTDAEYVGRGFRLVYKQEYCFESSSV